MEEKYGELRECRTPWARLCVLFKYYYYFSLHSLNTYYFDEKIVYYNIFDTSLKRKPNFVYCAICLAQINQFITACIICSDRQKIIHYAKCHSCEKHSLCKNCFHPTPICTSAKVTSILCLRFHVHRNIIPIIISYL